MASPNGLRARVLAAVLAGQTDTREISARLDSTVRRVSNALLALRKQGKVRSEYRRWNGTASRSLTWTIMPE